MRLTYTRISILFLAISTYISCIIFIMCNTNYMHFQTCIKKTRQKEQIFSRSVQEYQTLSFQLWKRLLIIIRNSLKELHLNYVNFCTFVNQNCYQTACFFYLYIQWWFVNPGSDSPEISLIRTKSAGTDFLFWTDGRFSNPENSFIRKYRPGTNVSGLTNHHCI